VVPRQKNRKRNTKSRNIKGIKFPYHRYFKDGASRRQMGTSFPIISRSKNKPLSDIRLSAIKDSEQMPIIEEYNWLQLGPTCIPFGETDSPARVLVSGRITSIVIVPEDPDTIYIGAAQGGIWKTTDGGRNWKPLSDQTDSLAIGDLVIAPQNSNILYAGTGEGNLMGVPSAATTYFGVGVLKTVNGGNEWVPKGKDIFIGARFFRLAVNPKDSNKIFAATSIGVYRSLDGGDDWKPMTNNLPKITENVKAASDLIIDPNNDKIVYAAFWADGIYKTENADADNPKWVKISKGIPSPIGRIALAISKTNSKILYTLMTNSVGTIKYFYMSENSGSDWIGIDLPIIRIWGREFHPKSNPGMGFQGLYNLNIIVDPKDSNIVYLSGVPLLKAIRNPRSGLWTFMDIGRNIHTDNHAFAFHPTDNMQIFTGNDGGIYKSTDGGITWIDTLNEGLCITQFTFMDQHPSSDAVVLAGTQDNGTLQFRNNPVFYLCDESDGGFVAIHRENPNIVFHERYDPTIRRSDEGGKFGLYENGGSWKKLYDGNSFGTIANETSLFFPPFTLDQSNSNNIALGTKNIYLYDQKQKKWDKPEQNKWEIIDLKELSSKEFISAINYVDSNLIYVGTTLGKIFLLKKITNKWTSYRLESNADIALPDNYIRDIATYCENNKYKKNSTIIVAFAGFIPDEDPPRVWRGEISDEKIVKWTNISGNDKANNTSLPNSPANAIVIDLNNPDTIYIGTDIGVFITTDGGESWKRLGIGLPKCAVLDMRLLYYKDDHNSMRLLRVVTHGRGMWEVELDKRHKNTVDLYVRDHIMDTGRFTPSLSGLVKYPGLVKAPFEDSLRNIQYDEKSNNFKFEDDYNYLFWWMCADIKIDSPFYQMDIDDVDYVKFEYRIRNKNPIAGFKNRLKNRIYVQVHNRGLKDASNVSIKLLYAKVINSVSEDTTKPFEPKLPVIPPNFWTDFYNPVNLGPWIQIGKIKSLPDKLKTLTNAEPTVICWEWETPTDLIDGRVGLLVVIDSKEDPIPEENKKIFDIEELVRIEKHIGVRVLKVEQNKYNI
jgi:photosystem II stability/assembly factor-like uncharacterized protein